MCLIFHNSLVHRKKCSPWSLSSSKSNIRKFLIFKTTERLATLSSLQHQPKKRRDVKSTHTRKQVYYKEIKNLRHVIQCKTLYARCEVVLCKRWTKWQYFPVLVSGHAPSWGHCSNKPKMQQVSDDITEKPTHTDEVQKAQLTGATTNAPLSNVTKSLDTLWGASSLLRLLYKVTKLYMSLIEVSTWRNTPLSSINPSGNSPFFPSIEYGIALEIWYLILLEFQVQLKSVPVEIF